MIEHLSNIKDPICNKFFGSVILFAFTFLNAEFPIVVTESGITNVIYSDWYSPHPSNAEFPIVVTESGIDI